jgi:hypothetical protein
MDIGNVIQFVSFINANNLINLDSSLSQVVRCMDTYSAACNCHKREDKLEIYATCNQTYYHAVKNVIPKLKPQFLATTSERQISFYNDQHQLIGTISR